MASDKTAVRILQRARELLGGEAPLAAALHTSPEMLSKWLSGEARPPSKAYLMALDLVTRSVEQRRSRLAR